MKLTRTTETVGEVTVPLSLAHAYQLALRAFNNVGSVESASEKSGTIKGVVGSGMGNMNPAQLVVEVAPHGDSQSRIVFHAAAEEGLIFQNTAEKAIARVQAAMDGRTAKSGCASVIWIIIAAVGAYWYFYERADVKVANMMEYYASHVNTSSLRSEDAERLARACLKFDKNPEYRFRSIVAYTNQYGSIVGSAFRSYNPESNSLANRVDALRLRNLVVQNTDYENAHFLEAVATASSGSSEPSPVNPQQPTPEIPTVSDLPREIYVATPAPVPRYRYVLKAPVSVSVPYGAMTVPAKTEVRVLRQTANAYRVQSGKLEFDVRADQLLSIPQ